MKRAIFLLLAFFITNFISAQTENYQTAIDFFHANYNAEKYEDIFNSFSSEMQQALPLESAKQFLVGLKTQVGKLESKAFVNYQQGTYASFKTKFEKAVLTVNISLDQQNKVNGLFIKPYEEPDKSEKRTVNALNNYPKEIAEIIFSRTKEFPTNTQLSIAIIEKGEMNYYGIVKENDSIKAIENQDKVFEIGSITKVFTSTVFTSLITDNKIKLSDTINAYFPFPFNDNIQLTFESLANHTSGLPRLPDNLDLNNESNPYKDYGKNQIEDYLISRLKLDSKPSKNYAYSNLGAGLLGYTLGLTQNTSFQHLLQKEVFDKYGMTNSYTSSQNLEEKLVYGLGENGEIVSNWDFDVLFGGGGILSTTEDLAKFATAQFNPENKELALTRKPTFTINDQMKIGLGWHILKSKKGKDLFWHNGGTGGYSSSMVINYETKSAVIILSNVSAFNPKMKEIDGLCFELINAAIR